MERINHKIFMVVLGFGILMIWLIAANGKEGMHLDEYLSFSLANSQPEANGYLYDIQYGREYSGLELYNELLNVSEATKFNIKNVFERQSSDTHPPLYYVVLHILSSIVDNAWMLKRIGLLLNIGLGLLIFYIISKIVNCFIQNEKISTVLSFLFCSTYGMVNGMIFIRMYVMLTLFTVLLSYLLIKNKSNDNKKLLFYIQLGLVSIGGILTQYFFLIFLCSIVLVYGIFLIRNKRFKELLIGGITIGLSMLISYLIFPVMYQHMFLQGRGSEVIGNAQEASLLQGVNRYLTIVDNDLFAGMLMTLLLCILVLFACCKEDYVKKIIEKKEQYIILLIPCILTFLFVAKSVPYYTMRYIYNLYFGFYLMVFLLLYQLLLSWSKRGAAMCIAIAIIIVGGGYKQYPFSMQNQDTTGQNEQLKMISEEKTTCYIIVATRWKAMNLLTDLRLFEKVVFIPNQEEYMGTFKEVIQEEEIVIFAESGNVEETLQNMFIQQEVSELEFLYQSGYVHIYHTLLQ